MNTFIKKLEEIQRRLNVIDERQKQALFSTEDYEKVEKEEKKIDWICENH